MSRCRPLPRMLHWEGRMCWLSGPQHGAGGKAAWVPEDLLHPLLPQKGLRGLPCNLGPPSPLPHRGAHFQDVGEQGWVLLDLGAEHGGELYLLLFCLGSRNCPTKSEKLLEGKKIKNR